MMKTFLSRVMPARSMSSIASVVNANAGAIAVALASTRAIAPVRAIDAMRASIGPVGGFRGEI